LTDNAAAALSAKTPLFLAGSLEVSASGTGGPEHVSRRQRREQRHHARLQRSVFSPRKALGLPEYLRSGFANPVPYATT
jgi:hypothetical protein